MSKIKRKPFGGKVANIANLCLALELYGRKNKTKTVPPTEVLKIVWHGKDVIVQG